MTRNWNHRHGVCLSAAPEAVTVSTRASLRPEGGSRMKCMSRRHMLKLAAAGAAGLGGVVHRPLLRTVIASDQYSSVVLAKGPVGYWRLGEGAGPTASDSSGNGYDGIYFGNPSFGQAGAIA